MQTESAGAAMKHSEIYRGKTLTCQVKLVSGHMRWECAINGAPSLSGIGASVKMLPSEILSEAIYAGRRAIDRSIKVSKLSSE
jgi:hypothetical protein